MRKLILGTLAVASGVCMAAPAMAQDEKEFGGFYAGALVGWDHVSVHDPVGSGSGDGVAYGAIIGYDASIGSGNGSGVIGLEGEVGSDSTSHTEQNILAVGDSGKLKAALDLYVGARAGIRAAPNILIYAKGGYTHARANLTYTNSAGTVFKDHDNLNGFRLGAGVEYALGRIHVRGEYRYSDYGSYNYNGIDTGIKTKRHQIVASLIGYF